MTSSSFISDVIKPESSSYSISDKYIQLVLNKSDTSVRWKSLERPIKSPRTLTPVGGGMVSPRTLTPVGGGVVSPRTLTPVGGGVVNPQEIGGGDITINNLDDDDDDDVTINNLDDVSVTNNKPVGRTAMNFEFNPFMLHRTEQTTPTRTTQPSNNGKRILIYY